MSNATGLAPARFPMSIDEDHISATKLVLGKDGMNMGEEHVDAGSLNKGLDSDVELSRDDKGLNSDLELNSGPLYMVQLMTAADLQSVTEEVEEGQQ